MSKIFVIAEVGVNHNGNLNIVKKLIKVAKNSGADFELEDISDLLNIIKNINN